MTLKIFLGLFFTILGILFFGINYILISSFFDYNAKSISEICLQDLYENYNEENGFEKCLKDGDLVFSSTQSISLILNLVSFISGFFFIFKGIKLLKN